MITLSGRLVWLKGRNIEAQIILDDLTKVQYKNDRLLIDGHQIDNPSQEFINRLDQAIRNFQFKIQRWIQFYVCNRQQIQKINQSNKKLCTRYLWISENFMEIRYSHQPLQKTNTSLPIIDLLYEYPIKDQKVKKLQDSKNLQSEYSLTVFNKKKQLHLQFLTFQQIYQFVSLINWIYRQRKPEQKIQFSAFNLVKLKLQQAAKREQLTLKRYWIRQLNQIISQYTLRMLKQVNNKQSSVLIKIKQTEQKEQKDKENTNPRCNSFKNFT
ncbi:hypothetical protein pb186bvf_006109 [Paramecium bursaria]